MCFFSNFYQTWNKGKCDMKNDKPALSDRNGRQSNWKVTYLKCILYRIYERKWKCSSFSHVGLFVTPWSSPGSSVHVILQTRTLEWVAIPFSRGSSQPRDWTWVSFIAGRFFYRLGHQGSPLYIEYIHLCNI